MRLFPGTLVLLSSLAHAEIRIVSPTSPWPTIQSAVDASQSEDTVFVTAGNYAGFALHNRSIRIVGASRDDVRISGTVAAENISPNRTIFLAGLLVESDSLGTTSTAGDPALVLRNVRAAVRIQNCLFSGMDGSAALAVR